VSPRLPSLEDSHAAIRTFASSQQLEAMAAAAEAETATATAKIDFKSYFFPQVTSPKYFIFVLYLFVNEM
jgi:hypothetical protein